MTPQEAIKKLQRFNPAENGKDSEFRCALTMAINALGEVSKGRWIDNGTYLSEVEEREIECPICGEEVRTTQGYFRYCPWCGEEIGGKCE